MLMNIFTKHQWPKFLSLAVLPTLLAIGLGLGSELNLQDQSAMAQTSVNQTSTPAAQNQTSVNQTAAGEQQPSLTSEDFSEIRNNLNIARDALFEGNREVAYDYLTTADSELFEFLLPPENQTATE
jgi:hypothetical protein